MKTTSYQVERQWEAILKADIEVDRAQKRLRAAIQKAFPVGASISVTLGGASIVAVVDGHGDGPWSSTITCHNLTTGKTRRFSVIANPPNRLGV